ncbi:MAG: MFS transporter [Pseudomonadota bacterium]
MNKNPYPPASQAWFVWGLGVALFFTGFYQRVSPGVMTDQLMADFHIGAAALGNLSAFYFYSYVTMQIPTGILADYLGPRRVLTAGSLVAALGIFLFAAAPKLYMANLGRMFIGASVGVAWVATLKLSIHWFNPRRFVLMSGLAMFFGIAGGAVVAGTPLRLLVDHFGWRAVMFASSGITLALTIAIWLFVRDDPTNKGYASFAPPAFDGGRDGRKGLLTGLGKVLRYKNTWLLSIAPSALAGSVTAFGGLWGVPFLTTHYGLSAPQSAAITSALLVSWAAGSPLIGALSEKIGLRKPLYLISCAIACMGWAVVFYWPGLPVPLLIGVIIIVGFTSGSIMISVPFLRESVPPQWVGTVSGVCNMGLMLGPMTMPLAVGWFLDRNWKGIMVNGVRIYDMAAYRSGFLLIIIWCAFSFLLIALTKETGCRQAVGEDG